MRGVDRDRDMGGARLTPAREYQITGLNLVEWNLAFRRSIGYLLCGATSACHWCP